jgi:hypothetical protein
VLLAFGMKLLEDDNWMPNDEFKFTQGSFSVETRKCSRGFCGGISVLEIFFLESKIGFKKEKSKLWARLKENKFGLLRKSKDCFAFCPSNAELRPSEGKWDQPLKGIKTGKVNQIKQILVWENDKYEFAIAVVVKSVLSELELSWTRSENF